MKIVILAAGAGSRLGTEAPKPLTPLINGKSILALQLETIAQYVSLEHVWVIIGYHKEMIIEAFPQLHYVYNPDFAQENTAKSLLRAVSRLQEDVLWINGDVVFHPAVLEAVLTCQRNSMVVNVGPVGDEEVKYRTNAHGQILEVSKHVTIPQGEALGLNYLLKKDLPLFVSNLKKCTDGDYFEKALELCIEEGVAVWALPVDASHCTEIDFPADLERANRLLASWVNS